MSRRTLSFVLAFALLTAAALYGREAARNLPVTPAQVAGHYLFTTPRPDGASRDCLTLTPDGHFRGPGLHSVDDTQPTTGTWHLITRGHRTFLHVGSRDVGSGELPVSRHFYGTATITLGPVPGPNDCTRH